MSRPLGATSDVSCFSHWRGGPSFPSPNKATIPQTLDNFQTAELEGEGRWMALSP